MIAPMTANALVTRVLGKISILHLSRLRRMKMGSGDGTNCSSNWRVDFCHDMRASSMVAFSARCMMAAQVTPWR